MTDFQVIPHDELIARLIRYREDGRFTLAFAANLFVLSLSDEYWRLHGRQALFTFAYISHLEPHPFRQRFIHENPSYVCEVCGLQQAQAFDMARCRLEAKSGGGGSNGRPAEFLFDLEKVIGCEPRLPT